MEGKWKCFNCGREQIGGKYCGNCGSPNPYYTDITATQETPTYYNNLNAITPPTVESSPGPTETPLPTPSPTFDRHIRFTKINQSGEWTLYNDFDNGYDVWYSDKQGYIAYDNDREVYHIYPDGNVNIKDADGNNYQFSKTMTINDIARDMEVECTDGFLYKVKDGVIVERKTITSPEKRFVVRSENHDTKEIADRLNGIVIKQNDIQGSIAYDLNGNELYHLYPDGYGTVQLPDGRVSPIDENTFDINTYRKDMAIKDVHGWEYKLVDGRVNERIMYEDGKVLAHEYFNDDKTSRIEYGSGRVEYSYRDGYRYITYKEVEPDGTILISDLTIKPDNTFYNETT